MPAVLARYPDALLVIAGRGPDMSPLAKLCNELGVRGQVLLPGKVPSDDLAALYDRCAVFALPTESGAGGQVEGFGLVFAEAAARGKPVVAGRAGGVVDAVLDGETGLLVPPGDAGATADALLRLFDDPALAERLGQAGLDRVAHELNWRRFAEGVLAAADEHC
jgi:phosphatidylinositol alpha-1,6-mannosyltransferase